MDQDSKIIQIIPVPIPTWAVFYNCDTDGSPCCTQMHLVALYD
jgi:hypothetical protein